MKKTYSLDKIHDLKFDIDLPSIVFLKGDLGAGKTTLSQHIIGNIFGISDEVTSPTYTYYNRYSLPNNTGDIYHFDLYRISEYEEFIHIGGEEILDNNNGLIIVEWPDILGDTYQPDVIIEIFSASETDERQLTITKKGE